MFLRKVETAFEEALHIVRPHYPRWARGAARALDRLMWPDCDVIEWGSGGSTPWLAKRCGTIVSIEHDKGYYAKAVTAVEGFSHALVLLRDKCYADCWPVDVMIVDGIQRHECAMAAVRALRAGGILVIDDIGRYDWDDFWTQTRSWRVEAWKRGKIRETLILRKPKEQGG